jgi:hypothetical protein
LILASISREGDSALVVAVLVGVVFFILVAFRSAGFLTCEAINQQSSAPADMSWEVSASRGIKKELSALE